MYDVLASVRTAAVLLAVASVPGCIVARAPGPYQPAGRATAAQPTRSTTGAEQARQDEARRRREAEQARAQAEQATARERAERQRLARELEALKAKRTRMQDQPAVATASDSSRWAVVIGVDGYRTLGRAKYGAADAQLVAKTLQERCAFPAKQVVTLADGDPDRPPTSGNITYYLKTLLRLAEAGDLVLVYLAGHGMDGPDGTQYFLPIDLPLEPEASAAERQKTLQRMAVPISDVQQWLCACKASRKVLVLDTCRTIADRSDVLVGNQEQHRQRILAAQADFVQVLASTGKSYPDDAAGHGAFTHRFVEALIQGDQDGDGRVTLAEAFAAARARMRSWVLEPGGKPQTPELREPAKGARSDQIVLSPKASK